MTNPFYLSENHVGAGGPNEWLRIFVAPIEVAEHGLLECAHSGVRTAAHTSFCDLGKETFHEVQPTGSSVSEVTIVTRVAG